jgi:hypothetical protein
MRAVLIVICLITGIRVFSQDEIINPKYPYELVAPQAIPDLMPGNYLVRTDADYFNLLNADVFHPTQLPVFPLYEDIGLVLKREFPSGSIAIVVDSVIETKADVIVNIRAIKPRYGTCDMAARYIFIRLKRTDKQILVSEVTEEYPPNDPGIEYPGVHH